MHLQVLATPDTPATPYQVVADYLPGTLVDQQPMTLPIHYSAGTERYEIDMAGFYVEHTDPEVVVREAVPILKALVNLARLPSYVFIARRSRQIYPVYTIGDDVMAATPGGPVFRHRELAVVRERLAAYLHTTGVLGRPGASDKLHVRGVNPATLALIRPRFYLKKRVPNQTDFWAPVFASDTEIYTFAASARRAVPQGSVAAIFALHTVVSNALIDQKRLRDPFDLRIDRLFPDDWEALRADTTPADPPLEAAGSAWPVYVHGATLIAVEERSERGIARPSLFLGKDRGDLVARIERDFARRGLTPEAVAA
ncbi:MAG TPA: hypothetical protein VD886_18905 [Herpetosiphonaceae bacterium]|nr:hypothetical protein [Herpetosiphonaceae bacterium]